ncbi:MAG: oxidoreductase [Clostridiales bacterium]|nr:MAG: oxidoreductase [Clostridiales bacterium]
MSVKKVAVIGLGDISGIYLKNIARVFQNIELYGVCTHRVERAREAAAEYGASRVYETMEQAFADPEVDIVVNLTRPMEHFDVTMKALQAGKHVYTEKPLGATLEEGRKIRDFAASKGLKVAGAPDTFLGGGLQTCRKLIDDGFIGTPLGASAFMTCRGHERWHPNPEFYYKKGGGPMMDIGPYYLTAMVSLLGGIDTVSGMSKASFPTRTITSQPKYGTTIEVEAPTYQTGLMRFASGVIGTIFVTFDVYASETPRIEIYGSEGTLSVPDPNTFGGPVRLFRPGSGEFMEIPLTHGYAENSRGIGVADLANAIRDNRAPRAGVDLMYHVLEAFAAFERSNASGAHIKLESTIERPAPLAFSELAGVLDD